ncbi:long-chain fatty acid--CoA ligase [Variovorax sp. V213]|uniref:AMP-binding protein n=1 Tax=Variovorax sp. V213 TaxID=3065955 RepID=UPI0034E8F464
MNNRPWLEWYPPHVPHTIEPLKEYQTLADFFSALFYQFSDRIAIRHESSELSYSTLDSLSLGIAAYLQTLGLEAGAKVAVALPNSPQYVITAIGVIRAGMVLVNVNPAYTAREFLLQVSDAQAEAAILLESQFDAVKDGLPQTKIDHLILCNLRVALKPARESLRADGAGGKSVIDMPQALSLGMSSTYSTPRLDKNDTVVLQYTGGTTGVSKGAMLSHEGLLANTAQNSAWFQPALADIPVPVFACALPLYHIVSFITLLASIKLGGTMLLITDPRDSAKMLAKLREAPFHMLPGINTLFSNLMNDPEFDTVDWRHLKVTTAGGMATQRPIAARWLERTGCAISEGYGLSETSGTVSCNPPHGDIRQGTVGPPAPSTEVLIVDEKFQALPLGEIGQIAVRGPQLFKGYWQRDAETARFMTKDGFFLTGDLGCIDEHGYLCISGREKEMMLVSGFNVYPSEIEAVAIEMDQVLECAAVGVPDELTGEAVKLVVVPRSDALTEESIRQHMKANLTAYKRPKIIEFRSKLPRSAVGKLLRASLGAAL